jgi:hypothetical protein
MDTILKGDNLRIISAKFGWDWLSSFRGENLTKISSPLFSNLHNRSKWVMEFSYPAILELLPFFHQFFFLILILFVLYFKNYLEIDVRFKLQKFAACQDLPTLQFWSKFHYPFWPIMQIRKKGGWNFC